MKGINRTAQVFIATVIIMGMAVISYGVANWSSTDWVRLLCYLGVALAASGLKVKLPRITGTMSVNFLFILIGIAELSFAETLLIGTSAILMQCLWKVQRKPNWVQVAFNVSSVSFAIGLAYYAANYALLNVLNHNMGLRLVSAASIYFVANTIPVAMVISLTEKQSFAKIWKECYFWSFPYYLIGAAFAGLVSVVNKQISWQTTLLLMPVIFWIFRSYRQYLSRLEDEKRHVDEMAELHLRTIEALALAIEAKDHTTHDHLRRVRVYAVEIAKEIGATEDEIEALRAAALLHDIGKLAVPEHIISKPGKLTQEEFEKMKIHPVVGAELLERVQFPYPVVPIVRSHHEKWDGSGYPDGLAGVNIPLGARILSAVDCLDALASDRQYRRALPLDEAMDRISSLSGIDFDPKVVDVLARRYKELETKARAQGPDRSRLNTDIKIHRGVAPAEGFQVAEPSSNIDFLTSIAAARQEAQQLFELSQTLGNSLSLDETISVLSIRLKKIVPYDSFAIYILKDKHLEPEFVNGENLRLFSSLRIPLGQGLSGWVAENRMPILNGNPSVEPGYLNDPSRFSTLRSALAVPLEGLNGVLGVMALYRDQKDAFNQDNLRVLLAISAKVALAIENSLKYQMAESSATTDYLTGLPNARSLFMHLDRELSRCKRMKTSLSVLVCDLNGFKQVNDMHGHLEGNKVLRTIAKRFNDACREYDYVARMGGDEFVVVMPGMAADAVESKIEQLKTITIEAGIEICGEKLLSLSVGEVSYPKGANDAEQLLAEADRRMYSNKRQHYALLNSQNAVSKASDRMIM